MKFSAKTLFACPAGIIAIIAAAFISLTLATPSQAHAATAAELQAQAQDTLQQLSAMQATLDEASSRYFSALDEYRQATEKCDKAQARIDEISGEIAQIQGRLGNRARDMYRNGSKNILDLLLGAASFDELAQNWDLLNRLNTSDADLSMKAKELREETEEQKAVYTQESKVAEEKSNEAAAAMEEATVLVEQMQATYESLSEEAQIALAQEQAAVAGGAGGVVTEGGVQNDDGTVTDIATGQVYASAAEYSAVTGNAIVDRAMSQLGAAYVWGGVGGSWGGYDCSGFVSYALTGSNTRLGTSETMLGWPEVSDPQPGDVCVIHNGTSQHVGIYIGGGKMIDAHDSASGVSINDVQAGMSYHRQG